MKPCFHIFQQPDERPATLLRERARDCLALAVRADHQALERLATVAGELAAAARAQADAMTQREPSDAAAAGPGAGAGAGGDDEPNT